MIKYTLSIIFSLTFTLAFSQNVKVPEAEAARQNLKGLGDDNNITGVVNSFDQRYQGIKGTPHFSKTWDKATISFPNRTFDNIPVKYNVYDNSIHFKNSKSIEMVMDGNKVTQFVTIDSITQKHQNFKKLGLLGNFEASELNRFGLLHHEGRKVLFIMLPRKNLLKANYQGAYSAGRTYDQFIDEKYYYIIKNGNPFNVKLNKKNLITVTKDQKDKIESFIKNEKVDVSTEEGWIKTLTYYETL